MSCLDRFAVWFETNWTKNVDLVRVFELFKQCHDSVLGEIDINLLVHGCMAPETNKTLNYCLESRMNDLRPSNFRSPSGKIHCHCWKSKLLLSNAMQHMQLKTKHMQCVIMAFCGFEQFRFNFPLDSQQVQNVQGRVIHTGARILVQIKLGHTVDLRKWYAIVVPIDLISRTTFDSWMSALVVPAKTCKPTEWSKLVVENQLCIYLFLIQNMTWSWPMTDCPNNVFCFWWKRWALNFRSDWKYQMDRPKVWSKKLSWHNSRFICLYFVLAGGLDNFTYLNMKHPEHETNSCLECARGDDASLNPKTYVKSVHRWQKHKTLEYVSSNDHLYLTSLISHPTHELIHQSSVLRNLSNWEHEHEKKHRKQPINMSSLCTQDVIWLYSRSSH